MFERVGDRHYGPPNLGGAGILDDLRCEEEAGDLVLNRCGPCGRGVLDLEQKNQPIHRASNQTTKNKRKRKGKKKENKEQAGIACSKAAPELGQKLRAEMVQLLHLHSAHA